MNKLTFNFQKNNDVIHHEISTHSFQIVCSNNEKTYVQMSCRKLGARRFVCFIFNINLMKCIFLYNTKGKQKGVSQRNYQSVWTPSVSRQILRLILRNKTTALRANLVAKLSLLLFILILKPAICSVSAVCWECMEHRKPAVDL